MHELPAVEKIVGTACERAASAGARSVESIKLTVGDRSGFIGESIEMYFDIVSKGTACEGSALEIEIIRSQLKCAACGALFIRKPFEFSCPVCGGEGSPTDIGREFFIDSITVV